LAGGGSILRSGFTVEAADFQVLSSAFCGRYPLSGVTMPVSFDAANTSLVSLFQPRYFSLPPTTVHSRISHRGTSPVLT
jgi:hypothetical protein